MLSPEFESQAKEGQNSEQLQAQYRSLVERSTVLNEKDKKAMLGFSKTDDGKNPDTLKKMIEHFPEAEKSADKINKEYRLQLVQETLAGRFAKKSMDAYEKWFQSLSFKEKTEFIRKKSTSLHDPERQKLLDAFNGKAEFNGVFIPAAVRNEFRREFFDSDLEQRKTLMKRISTQHKKLKERFLALPKEVQAKYREQFKGLRLSDREKLLKSITDARKGKKTPETQAQEKVETQRLENEFESKMVNYVRENLLSPLSIPSYRNWFKGLTLEQRHQALKKSDLDNPERKTVRDEFYKLPPETQTKNALRFKNADLEKRKYILAALKQETGKEPGRFGWIKNFLRRLTLSSGHTDIREKIETYAITNEIAERRHRFRLSRHTRKENAQKADREGMAETAKESRKFAQETELSSLQEKKGGIKVKTDILESHEEARHKWRRVLKPKIDDPNAKLSADITLRTKSGDEVIDEQAYQRGELERELDSVRSNVIPIIAAEARARGQSVDTKKITEEVKNADWEEYGKESIRKAA